MLFQKSTGQATGFPAKNQIIAIFKMHVPVTALRFCRSKPQAPPVPFRCNKRSPIGPAPHFNLCPIIQASTFKQTIIQ